MTEAAQAPKAATGKTTSYIVLAWENEEAPSGVAPPSLWRKVGEFPARSAEQAIRAYAAKSGSSTPLVLVAIPARSWAPVKVTPKTTTVLEIASA